MFSFFSSFPKMSFNNKVITDIATRLDYDTFSWLKNPSIYYDYDFQETDTIENIAAKYYGDATLHWILLLSNGIVNPKFELPMNQSIFIKYLNKKYKTEASIVNMTGVGYAMSTTDPVYGYQKLISTYNNTQRKTLSRDIYLLDEYNYNLIIPKTHTFTDEYNESITYKVEKRPLVTIYAREVEINEGKRRIKILKKEFKQHFISMYEQAIGSLG